MSRWNVELVRRSLRAYAERDADTLRALNDPVRICLYHETEEALQAVGLAR